MLHEECKHSTLLNAFFRGLPKVFKRSFPPNEEDANNNHVLLIGIKLYNFKKIILQFSAAYLQISKNITTN